MIKEEVINRALRHAINLITGLEEHALRGQQDDALQPNRPFATVTLLADDSEGVPFTSYENTSDRVDAYVESAQLVTYTLQFFHDGAYDRARLVQISLVREDVKALFRVLGLGFRFTSTVTNISEPLEPGWQERATFDVELAYIERVSLTEDTENGANTIDSYSIDASINEVISEITCGDIPNEHKR